MSTVLTCPHCAEEVAATDLFCEACGQDLRPTPPEVVELCVRCGDGTVDADGYCQSCGRLQPEPTDHTEVDLGVVAGVTDKGLRHHRNEDSMAVARAGDSWVAVVCDGVSTSPRPEEASRLAADTGLAILAEAATAGGESTEASLRAAHAAAEAVAGLGTPEAAPACTYVSAIVTPTTVTVAWIGDSRAYWLPKPGTGEGNQLTVDDSWAVEMVAAGLLTEAEAAADRRAHAITRWLGTDAGPAEPRSVTFTPSGPGTVLVCSDGLWNYLPDAAALGAALGELAGEALEPARALVRIALDAGGHDNITVVLLPVPLRSSHE